MRSRLDYADIIYDQAYNSAFHDKLESVQYNACFAMTGAIIRYKILHEKSPLFI